MENKVTHIHILQMINETNYLFNLKCNTRTLIKDVDWSG